ncbi:MAG: hypothetical protein SWQ30_14600 [Thermodesulfobacteriota bacterium]|nr:hypothetical protein [Thermodesulfobacteriota bacterium]
MKEVIESALRSMAVISLLLFFLVGHTEAGLEPTYVEFKDDLVTVRGNQADVFSVLEEISEWVGAQVFVFDGITQHNVRVHFVDRPAEEVVKALLKGHNYAIIYSSGPSPLTGVYVLGGTGRDTKRVGPGTRISRAPQGTGGMDREGSALGYGVARQEDAGGVNDEMSWAVEEAETYLLGEIEKLEWQIAARQSDSDYNPSAKTLGLSPIQHDRDLLEQHKHQLRRLQQQ